MSEAYFTASSAYHCHCGRDKRANAILCRACWFLLPAELRDRLLLKTSDPTFTTIRDLCLEYSHLQSAHAVGPRRMRKEIPRRQRMKEIISEVCGIAARRAAA